MKISRTVASLAVVALAGALLNGHAAAASISSGYTAPPGKQGVTDAKYVDDNGTDLDARYRTFQAFGLHAKIYNIWWSELESSIPSSATPIACPGQFQLVPANNVELVAKGYRRYRCLSSAAIAKWDNLIGKDAANNFQSAVVLWSAPTQYRHAACNGFVWENVRIHDGCVPRDDAMDDWEDYVNFLADRYSASSQRGKISHFVIWNEAASGAWFDYSPTVPTTVAALSGAQQQAWIQKYANMMATAHGAIARHTSGVLMHASLDKLWQPPAFDGITHIGTKNVLDGIWNLLGTGIDWSVAIHPYGDPVTEGGSDINFQHVSVLARYQRDKLIAAGATAPLARPQLKLFASEQGWQAGEGIEIQARNICEAQSISDRNPSLIAQTHNFFQELQQDRPSSAGLVPMSAGQALENAGGIATFEAYRATGSAYWGKRDDHLCCQLHGLGCTDARAIGAASALSNNTLPGWSAAALIDRNGGTAYSSNPFPSAVNHNRTTVTVYLPGRSSGGYMISTVKLHARMVNGVPNGFPARYRLFLTNGDNTAWDDFGSFTIQPDQTGVATIALPRIARTFGMYILPEVLGKDEHGSYYFQMSEIELIPSLGNAAVLSYDLGGATSNNVLDGWPADRLTDHRDGTIYSSNVSAHAANTDGTFVAAWVQSPTVASVAAVRLKARMANGVPLAFPARYRIHLTSPDNSTWVDMGEFGNQPDANGDAIVALPQIHQTWGVRVQPLELGQDDNGTYYFQLAELELLP